jgi:hypothetical protein
MNGGSLLHRAFHALGLLLVVCLGVRIASWLIEPVVPSLAVLLLLAVLIYFVVAGPRSRS